MEYLCSNTLISSISGAKGQSSRFDAPVASARKPSDSLEVANFAKSSYSDSSQGNYSQSQYSNYSQSVQNNYQLGDTEPASYNYNYKSSFQSSKPETSQGPSNITSSDAYDKNSQVSYSVSNPDPASDRSYQYGYSSANEYNSNYVNQSYANPNSNTDAYTSSYQPRQEAQYQYATEQDSGSQEQDRPYSETVRQYLNVVSQVFMAYADPTEYTVTKADVQGLLRDTYSVLGREEYEPSSDDVDTWMKLCDVNQDGKVEYQEYEYFVIKSLERSGLNLYD